MSDILYSMLPFVFGLLCILLAYLYYIHAFNKDRVQEDGSTSKKIVEEPKAAKVGTKSKKLAVLKKRETKDTFTHEWLHTSLKGHTGEILDMDFTSNGKYFASCGNDRAVMLWDLKNFEEKNHRSVRVNIEFDHATQFKWTPTKAFIISTDAGNTVQIYKVSKRNDGILGNPELHLTFDEAHKQEIINIGFACNGTFIMTCSCDTTVIIWDLKGQILATLDTLSISNYHACVSPCARFVASSGFTPEVRVWEVCFDKTGDFKEVKRAFELKGHTAGICHFCFSADSTRMLTTSKDGTWKLYDTNVEYTKGQEPYLLKSFKHGINTNTTCALSIDGRTIAIASTAASNVFIYSGVSGDLQAELKEIHSDPVSSMLYSPDGQYLFVAAGRHIRVFINIPGYQNIILGLEEVKSSASNPSMRERLQHQIDDAKLALKKAMEKS